MMVGKNKDEGRKVSWTTCCMTNTRCGGAATDLHRAAINYQFELKTQRRVGLEPFKGSCAGPENGGVLNPVKDWA